jgi:hypothetical protein
MPLNEEIFPLLGTFGRPSSSTRLSQVSEGPSPEGPSPGQSILEVEKVRMQVLCSCFVLVYP